MNNAGLSIIGNRSNDYIKIPSTDEVRTRLQNALYDSLQKQKKIVHRSPTSSGKTYTAVTTPWRQYPDITGGEPVTYFTFTTDAREEAKKKNADSSANSQMLLGREDACPIVAGEYDDCMDALDGGDPSEWFDTMTDDRGIPVSVAHEHFERNHDGELPCSPCRLQSQWDGVPRDEDGNPDSDVIIATHQFARAPELIKDCNVIIDESPDFTINKNIEDFRKHIRSYLEHIDAPVQTWEDFAATYCDEPSGTRVRNEFSDPDTNWYFESDNAHVLVPGIVDAILSAQRGRHNRWVGETAYRYPDLNPHADTPDHQVQIRVVIDDNYDLNILQVLPDFSEARCVIGLDAFPTKPKWSKNTLDDIDFNRILDEREEQLWRKHERDLEIIQVGDYKYPWTRKGYNQQKVKGLCSEVQYHYDGSLTSGVTSKRFSSNLEDDMEAVGINDPDVIYYGIEKSVERFADERVGVVFGCISPSSDYIEDWLALLDKNATPKREVNEDYEGQQWVGPDADVAHDLIADVREKRVLQAVGRYARSPNDPDDSATVYVMTNVLPDKWIDGYIDEVNVLGQKQREIVDLLYQSVEGLTAGEIAKETSASRKHVHDTLDQIQQASWCTVDPVEKHNQGDVYNVSRNEDCVVIM